MAHRTRDMDLLELERLAELSLYENLAPAVSYIKDGNLVPLLEKLVEHIQIGDNGPISKTARLLARFVEMANFILYDASVETSSNLPLRLVLVENRPVLEKYHLALCSHVKSFNKVFAARKPTIVAHFVRLLKGTVEFRDTGIVHELVALLDFGSAFARLFVPTKDDFDAGIVSSVSMRFNVMLFWVDLCVETPASLRKAVFGKTTPHVWDYMYMDRFELLAGLLNMVSGCVIHESSYRRSTKAQVLNDRFLANFRKLFPLLAANTRTDDADEYEEFKSVYGHLMAVLVQKEGISFPQNKNGTSLLVNGKEYKVNNRAIFHYLTQFKPWESLDETNYVLHILRHNQELVPPYMHHFVANGRGYHEPSVSAYWLGCTYLFTEIIKLPSQPITFEHISLFPLSRAAVTACLQYPDALVQQLTLQLILQQLKKLKTASHLLVSSVLRNLPDQSCLVRFLASNEKLTRLTSTLIVREMEALAPASSLSSVLAAIAKMQNELEVAEGSFDMLLLDNCLSIQASNDLKWSNKLGLHSFFVSLLKLARIKSLRLKVYATLLSLTSNTLVFGKSGLQPPLAALVDSVSSYDDETIWNCLDEVISRLVKTPYKYLDRSHAQHSDLSVFFVVLFEQLGHFEVNETVTAWVNDLVARLEIIGEPAKPMKSLASDLGIDIKTKKFPTVQAIKTVFELGNEILLFNRKASRAKSSWVFAMVEKIANFLSVTSDDMVLSHISNPQTWHAFSMLLELDEKTMLVLALLNEMFVQLNENFQSTKLNGFVFEECKRTQPLKAQKILAKFLWVLTHEQLCQLDNYDNSHLIVDILLASKQKPNLALLPRDPRVITLLSDYEPSGDEIPTIVATPSLHTLLQKPSSAISEHIGVSDESAIYHAAAGNEEIAQKYPAVVKRLALGMTNWDLSFKVFKTNLTLFETLEVLDAIFSNLADKRAFDLNPSVVELFAVMPSEARLQPWVQQTMLFINKTLAENPEPSLAFNAFLGSMEAFVSKGPIFDENLATTQAEIILTKHSGCSAYMRYAVKLIVASDVNAAKLLQLFLTNTSNVLAKLPSHDNAEIRFLSAAAVHALYRKGPKATESLMTQVLLLYLGTTRAEDLLLKEVLVGMENELSLSWVEKVHTWDFLHEVSAEEFELVGEDRLVMSDKSGLVVALKRNFVTNSVRRLSEVARFSGSAFSDYERFGSLCQSPPYKDTVYDHEFLLMAVLNVPELSGTKFDVDRWIQSGFLQFVVECLGLESAKPISTSILETLFKHLTTEVEYETKGIVKMLLASIINTQRQKIDVPPLIWHAAATLLEIVADPTHFLYEAAFNYILTHPVWSPKEIPLANHEDDYYKHTVWLLEFLIHGVRFKEDLETLLVCGVMEKMLTLATLAYTRPMLKSKVLALLNKVVDLDGTQAAVVYGAPTFLELLEDENSQVQLNINQLAFKLHLGRKRTRDFTHGTTKRLRVA